MSEVEQLIERAEQRWRRDTRQGVVSAWCSVALCSAGALVSFGLLFWVMNDQETFGPSVQVALILASLAGCVLGVAGAHRSWELLQGWKNLGMSRDTFITELRGQATDDV